MPLPTFPVEGGCLCGAWRYQITAMPLAVYNCHCKDCQRLTGSSYGTSMPTRREHVRHLSGRAVAFDKVADSGRVVRMLACVQCGGRCWNEPLASPDLLILRPGTLDDSSWAAPIGNIWTASRVPFAEIDRDWVNFEAQPPSREPLYARWAERMAEVA